MKELLKNYIEKKTIEMKQDKYCQMDLDDLKATRKTIETKIQLAQNKKDYIEQKTDVDSDRYENTRYFDDLISVDKSLKRKAIGRHFIRINLPSTLGFTTIGLLEYAQNLGGIENLVKDPAVPVFAGLSGALVGTCVGTGAYLLEPFGAVIGDIVRENMLDKKIEKYKSELAFVKDELLDRGEYEIEFDKTEQPANVTILTKEEMSNQNQTEDFKEFFDGEDQDGEELNLDDYNEYIADGTDMGL